MTTHVNFTSGGTGSWATGVRIIEAHARAGDKFVSVFADTMMEDEDLYRFLADCEVDFAKRCAERDIEFESVHLRDGRDVWQVFFDERFLGNSRIDPCSKVLKRTLMRKWVNENLDPENSVVYLGIDWSEAHRFDKSVPYWEPYTVQAPLTEPPYVDKDGIRRSLKEAGIEIPRLYKMGFARNNCGGFCVKAGKATFLTLLENMPERYAYHERREQELREYLGKDVTILNDTSRKDIMARLGLTDDDVERYVAEEKVLPSGRVHKKYRLRVLATGEDVPAKKPITLREFRERVQSRQTEVDPFDVGGCACFTPDDYERDESNVNNNGVRE